MNNDESKELETLHVLLLTNFQKIEENLPRIPQINGILTGSYGDTLNEQFARLSRQLILKDGNLREKISIILESRENVLDCILAAISSLDYFVQCNWTGPEDVEDVNWLIGYRDEALIDLTRSDQCNDNLMKPELLYFSKIIFNSEEARKLCKTCDWWALRTNFLHDIVIDEKSDDLLAESENCIKNIEKSDILRDDFLRILFNLEVGQFYLRHKRIQCSEKCLSAAQELAGLSLELCGAMGKRTKFQREAKAQLYLDVRQTKEIFPCRHCPDLPKPLELNDELRLERIEFEETKERSLLGSLEESIILAKCFQLLLSQPKDKLTDEEIIPYLNYVIESTKNWPLLMSALHQRCLMELRDKRTVERAMAQAENLMELLNHAVPPIYNRIDYFFASGMKPAWTFKQILADAMLSLGLVKGALDIYLKLHLWEDVIVCYTILELRHKAAEIIRQEIAKKPTVKLWCLLGDATQEIEHYETAWKFSTGKSSRAQRHWGFYYFAKQNYQEAIPHLKLSAELNNIQENVWIRLGFAALQVEDWKLAAMAYRRYCNLEQTTFEAWNNLAKAYIKMGDKERAWRSLQDAIKCNYDRWEVWDNLMIVSIDLGHFSEVIRCYHRILDLKGDHVDVQVLGIMTRAVEDDKNDRDGNGARKLLPKILELFGRVTSKVATNSDVWRFYAKLTILNGTELDSQKAAQYLQRSYRAAISDARWSRSVEGVEGLLDLSSQLGNTYLQCLADVTIAQKRSMLGSAKLCLQSILSKVKNHEFVECKTIRGRVESLEKLLETIRVEFDKIRAND